MAETFDNFWLDRMAERGYIEREGKSSFRRLRVWDADEIEAIHAEIMALWRSRPEQEPAKWEGEE